MPSHLYCLLPGGSDAKPPTDLGVRAIEIGQVIAWIGDADQRRVSREGRKAAESALQHDRVLARALAKGVTPVPATLADAYPDDDDVRRDVSARADEIGKCFERVEGAVEMAVILAAPSEAPEATTGRAYLEQLRDLPATLAATGDEIDGRVGPLVIAATRRASSGRLGLSHLVRRIDVDAYRSAVLGAASGRVRLVVDGPRAPYSFAAFAPRIEVL